MGIIILFIVMTIIRQVIEPKIVGKSLGVHPILTLIPISLYFNGNLVKLELFQIKNICLTLHQKQKQQLNLSRYEKRKRYKNRAELA